MLKLIQSNQRQTEVKCRKSKGFWEHKIHYNNLCIWLNQSFSKAEIPGCYSWPSSTELLLMQSVKLNWFKCWTSHELICSIRFGSWKAGSLNLRPRWWECLHIKTHLLSLPSETVSFSRIIPTELHKTVSTSSCCFLSFDFCLNLLEKWK